MNSPLSREELEKHLLRVREHTTLDDDAVVDVMMGFIDRYTNAKVLEALQSLPKIASSDIYWVSGKDLDKKVRQLYKGDK